jgi:hypothetical protein
VEPDERVVGHETPILARSFSTGTIGGGARSCRRLGPSNSFANVSAR